MSSVRKSAVLNLLCAHRVLFSVLRTCQQNLFAFRTNFVSSVRKSAQTPEVTPSLRVLVTLYVYIILAEKYADRETVSDYSGSRKSVVLLLLTCLVASQPSHYRKSSRHPEKASLFGVLVSL